MTEVLEKPDTVVELDVDLDIVPMCEGTWKGDQREPCQNEAEWAVRVMCDACSNKKVGLYCDPHRAGMHPDGKVRCSQCKQHELVIISAVRL